MDLLIYPFLFFLGEIIPKVLTQLCHTLTYIIGLIKCQNQEDLKKEQIRAKSEIKKMVEMLIYYYRIFEFGFVTRYDLDISALLAKNMKKFFEYDLQEIGFSESENNAKTMVKYVAKEMDAALIEIMGPYMLIASTFSDPMIKVLYNSEFFC